MGRSLVLFLLGIVRRVYYLFPSVFFDPFEIYTKTIKPQLSPKYQWDMTLPSEWFPLAIGLLVLWTAFLTYHDLRKSNGVESVEYTIKVIRKFQLKIGGHERSLAYLVKTLQNQLNYGQSNHNLIQLMRTIKVQRDPLTILGKLREFGLVNVEFVDPAPGSTSAVRATPEDVFYDKYT